MANTFKQPPQSDLDREEFRLGLASAQSKAYTQSQANPSQSATEIDYTTAPDRISLYDLNKLNQSIASGMPISDTPVLDFWKRQQEAKSAVGTDYTYALDRIPFTQANAWAGSTAAGTKATNLSSAQQPAPWLNTPQYGDDGAVL